jgi:hypothetical protein
MSKQMPIPENHQLLMSWLSVIGMLILYWSPVERIIDQCVHILRESQTRPRKRKPLKLGEKLKFIESAMPPEIIGKAELENLAIQTRATVQIRDVCVHGTLRSFNEQKIEIDKVDGKHNEHVIEVFTIDRDRLERSAASLISLESKWNSVVSALTQLVGHE